MRKLIVSESLTIDGVMEASERWVGPFWSDATTQYKLREMMESDALLIGRVTYEIFAGAWPEMSDSIGFAERMNGVAKHVVSSTLVKPAWSNSSVIDGDLIAAITRLKAQPGRNILVVGSASLVNYLIQHQLVDELRLMIFPTIRGAGVRLFSDENPAANLELKETTALPHGVTVLTYVPATTGPAGEFPDHFKHH